MRIKTQPAAQNSQVPRKRKINQKRLIIIFSATFAAVLLIGVTVASLLTPTIDVPQLDDEQSLSDVTSNDFKGRIDDRLKSIEMEEQSSPSQSTTNANNTQNVNNQNTQSQDQTVDNTQQVQDNSQDYDTNQLPYDSREDVQSDTDSAFQDTSVDQSSIQQPSVQPKPTVQKTNSKTSTPAPKPLLREKVKQQDNQSISMAKVMVGSFSTPYEAQKASQNLASSSLNVTPFIKESNGTYTLQVGSFSSTSKAENLASELRKRNFQPKIIQE